MNEPEGATTKAERVRSTLAAASSQDLHRAAELFVQANGLGAELRNRIQDVLWDGVGPVIWERTRRAIAASVTIDDLVTDQVRFETMLDRWWILGTVSPFEGIFPKTDTSTLAWAFGPTSTAHILRKRIKRHVFDNPGD